VRLARVAALVSFFTLLGAAPASAAPLTGAEQSLLGEINRVRAVHGLAPLRTDPTLQRAARAHSADMLRRGYFGHGAFGTRMKRFGAQGPSLAENLAWGAGQRGQPREVVAAWLRSPGHRANLLRPGFRRIGVAAPLGTFFGRPGTTVVTADFAGR
jgi:uncharacterized protein YkwD